MQTTRYGLSGRVWRKTAGVLTIACVGGLSYFVYDVVRAERSHLPEDSFQGIAKGGMLFLGAVLFGGLYAFGGTRREVELAPSSSQDADGLGGSSALAAVSLLAGVLAWLPLLPVTSPLAYAATAILGGLFGLRLASRGRITNPDKGLAVAGTMLGGTYWCLYCWRKLLELWSGGS